MTSVRLRSLRLTTLPWVVLGMLAAASLAPAQEEPAVTLAIPASRDTTVMEQHPRDNDGAWGFLWLKWNSARGFENRVMLGFDVTALEGRGADIRSATIVLRAADHTFPVRGTGLGVYFMDPAAPVEWVEGSARFDRFGYCSLRDLFRPPTGEGGPGATWICEDDGGDVDPLGAPACAPPSPATSWTGGLAIGPEEPRGFRSVPSDAQVEHKLYDPLCRKALACFASGGGVDCWRKVELDVTADVRETLQLGRHQPSWLLKKDRVGAGGAHFFSREGAVCILGIPDLRPQLVVTLDARAGDSPLIAEPPDGCAASAP